MRDLLALSGYAFVYHELGNAGLWSVVDQTWDAYFSGLRAEGNDIDASILSIIRTVHGRDAFFSMSKRSGVQMAWMQAVSQDLMQKGIIEEDRGFTFFGRDERENHPSVFIEYMRRNTSLGLWRGKAEDLFIIGKLVSLVSEAQQNQMGVRVSDLLRQIERINQENADGEAEDGDDDDDEE